MFTNYRDYVAEYHIPFANNAAIDAFNVFISKYEPIVLRDLLGPRLYKEFSDGLDEVTPDQKWIDLRDGKELEYDSIYIAYEGVKSFIVPFIWYKYMMNSQTNSSSLGEIINDATNAKRTDNTNKLCAAWNDFVEKYGTEYNKSDAFNFLYYSNLIQENTYPNWDFRKHNKINNFGVYNG